MSRGAPRGLRRREFVRGALGAVLAGAWPGGARARGVARPLLLVDLEGGCDGVNTLIPHGDRDYAPSLRPSLFVPPERAIDAGNGFASLHGALRPLRELLRDRELALIHQVGTLGASRSHAMGRRAWRTASPTPIEDARARSWVARAGAREVVVRARPSELGDRLLELGEHVARAPMRVGRIILPGFDTHARQGGQEGRHAEALGALARAIQRLRRRTRPSAWRELLVLVTSEFGRTPRENGLGGTDHGGGGIALAAGGAVRGGVYGCDAASWPAGALTGEGLPQRTDFRALIAEVADRQLGVAHGALDGVVPGWSQLSGPAFDRVGFLRPT